MTFCFHLSFSLSLFTSTFPFLKVWLTAASWRRVHFRFLWLWLPQLGDMTDGRDRGNGPLSIHLPSSSNFGPGGKRQILVSQSNSVPHTHYKIWNTAKTLCSWLTSISVMSLLTSSNTCSGGEIGPIFWQSDPKMHWFGTTQYIILKNFIWSRFLLRRRPDVFHIFVGGSLQMIFTFPPSTTWFLVFLDCSAVRGVQRKNILNTAKQDRKRPKNYKAFFDVKKESARKSLVSRNCRTIWIELSFSHL